MARFKSVPFRVRTKEGRAILDFSTTERRYRVALGFAYVGDERASPAERAAAYAAAEQEFAALTSGRVIEPDPVVKTPLTFPEMYAGFLDAFEPSVRDDENTRRAKNAAVIVRRAYGRNILEWASDEARRPDGSRRWARDDRRTPLQRLCATGAPEDYLAYRLTLVTRVTMRKEKSNLVAFFAWAKAAGYLRNVPAVTLPSGKGVRALSTGRGVDIQLTGEESRRIVAVMPIWSSRPSRKPGAENRHRFLVRPFFELMWMTGLRPVTLMRLIVGRNWQRVRKGKRMVGQPFIVLTNADDKARYGRSLPIPREAVALLEKYATESGHIFGHHDFRSHVAAAAKLVLDERRAALFGSYHLRHFVGTFLASRTTNTAAGMYIMGHKDESTFSGYVHAREEEARRLVRATASELRKLSRDAERWAERKTKAERKEERRHVH